MTYLEAAPLTIMLIYSYSANAILPDYIMCAAQLHENNIKSQASANLPPDMMQKSAERSAPKSSASGNEQDTNTTTQELIKCNSTGFDAINKLKEKIIKSIE